MENSADALKIVLAIFIFITAFTVVFMMLTSAREAADTVFYYSDQTNWYEWNENNPEQNLSVGKDTVIASLYSFYGENLDITVIINSDIYRFNSAFYAKNGSQTTYNNRKDAIANVNSFIASNLNRDFFTVTCQEIKTSGLYEYGMDGTEITKAKGGTKLYITYTNV